MSRGLFALALAFRGASVQASAELQRAREHARAAELCDPVSWLAHIEDALGVLARGNKDGPTGGQRATRSLYDLIAADLTAIARRQHARDARTIHIHDHRIRSSDIDVDLSSRKVLAKILEALLDRACWHIAEPLPSIALSELVWPEKAEKQTKLNRLRVSIRQLRNLGLEALIETSAEGYSLNRDFDYCVRTW